MSKTMLRSGLTALLVAGLLGLASNVQAQFNFNPNMNPSFVSGLNQAQYMAFLQQAAAARAVQAQALFPTANPYTPVTANPYAAGAINRYNPYTTPTASPYDQGYNPYTPYYVDPSSALRGAADIMRAYGTVITSQEQARILRELALQARLETRKKRFDLDMYIKANTPTFTEEQAKIKKTTLKRIQSNSTEPEIFSGKALNLLLDDMRLYPGKKALAVEPFALSEDMLGHLNVTKTIASLGVLRNGGEFTWPVVFQEYFPPEQLRLIENQAKTLVKNAEKGKIDPNVLKDMRNEVDKMRDQLLKKANDIPPSQYLEAKRFLYDFDDARLALERGEALTQINFQKWVAGGKSVQQLVDYMIANGLKFASATQGDENAYRAAYSGMAALDVHLNIQNGSPLPEAVEAKENP